MVNTVVNMAASIYEELGSPESISVSYIASWLRANIGILNNYISSNIVIDPDTQEFSPILDDKQAVIYKTCFELAYYSRGSLSNLNAASAQSLAAISDEGSSVRWTNKGELAKTWIALHKEVKLKLNDLVTAYIVDKSKPTQVVGDENVPTYDEFTTYVNPNRSLD